MLWGICFRMGMQVKPNWHFAFADYSLAQYFR